MGLDWDERWKLMTHDLAASLAAACSLDTLDLVLLLLHVEMSWNSLHLIAIWLHHQRVLSYWHKQSSIILHTKYPIIPLVQLQFSRSNLGVFQSLIYQINQDWSELFKNVIISNILWYGVGVRLYFIFGDSGLLQLPCLPPYKYVCAQKLEIDVPFYHILGYWFILRDRNIQCTMRQSQKWVYWSPG